MHLPFFWRWLRWWCEPVVCLLPLGVPRSGLGSPSTQLSLSLYVDRGVARHAWLAVPVHGSPEGPRMGPDFFPLYLGFLLTISGNAIPTFGAVFTRLPRCAPISLQSCVCLCGLCVAELWTVAVRPPGPFG
ncbi:hypothetical protein V6N11_058319 [Hibiscus sabdariffa]|uniref:Secreted protein n=1 Tax=Hibiscus sabdariffa TaxID=183260 RepID=A0ABR2U4N9_9ROSI